MNDAKKIICLVLAAVTALSMGITAMADTVIDGPVSSVQ